jgi:hypothetical protein
MGALLLATHTLLFHHIGWSELILELPDEHKNEPGDKILPAPG